MRRKDLLALAQKSFPNWTWYGHHGHIVGCRSNVRGVQVSCTFGTFEVTLNRVFGVSFSGLDLKRAMVSALQYSADCAELEAQTTKAALREVEQVASVPVEVSNG